MKPPLTTGQVAWRLVMFRPWLYALGFVLSAIFENMPLLTGLILRAFFDRLTNRAPVAGNPWLPLAALFVSEAVRMSAVWSGYYVWATLSTSARSLLRKNMLDRLLHGAGPQRLPDSAGEAVSRFRDDVDEVYTYAEGWIDLGSGIIFTILGLGLLVAINPVVTLVVFLPLVLIVALANALTTRIRRFREASRVATGQVTGFIGEAFGAVQAIKVRGAEAGVVAHLRGLNRERGRTALRDRVLTQALESFNTNTVNISTGLVLILAAQSIRAGDFTIGDLALFVTFMPWLADFPRWIGRMLASYKQAGVSFRRLQDVVPAIPATDLVHHSPVFVPPAVTAPPPLVEPLERLVVRGLSYRYPGSERGITGVDLDLPRGSLTVVTGRIGSGKTTLVRALLGLLPHDTGEIRWNDRPVADPASFFVPPRSAYTPQVPRLFSDTLRNNIALGLPLDDGTLTRALHLAVLEPDVATLPNGLATEVGARGVRLSGGQVQRTAAARMFTRPAELLVLDDVSSALDVETEQLLWQRLAVYLAAGTRTCLVVSHRRAVLQRADTVVVVADGVVAAAGPLAQLLQTSPALRALWQAEPTSAGGAEQEADDAQQ